MNGRNHHNDWHPYKRRNLETETHTGRMLYAQRQPSTSQKRGQIQVLSSQPAEGTNRVTTLILVFSLQSCKTGNSCCLSHSACATLFGSPSKLIYSLRDITACLYWMAKRRTFRRWEKKLPHRKHLFTLDTPGFNFLNSPVQINTIGCGFCCFH